MQNLAELGAGQSAQPARRSGKPRKEAELIENSRSSIGVKATTGHNTRRYIAQRENGARTPEVTAGDGDRHDTEQDGGWLDSLLDCKPIVTGESPKLQGLHPD